MVWNEESRQWHRCRESLDRAQHVRVPSRACALCADPCSSSTTPPTSLQVARLLWHAEARGGRSAGLGPPHAPWASSSLTACGRAACDDDEPSSFGEQTLMRHTIRNSYNCSLTIREKACEKNAITAPTHISTAKGAEQAAERLLAASSAAQP